MVDERDAPQEIKFEIEYPEPDPTMATYANQLVVFRTSDEFVLTFYRLLPTISHIAAAEQLIDLPVKVPAQPVARIVVPISKLESFARALRANVEPDPAEAESEDEA